MTLQSEKPPEKKARKLRAGEIVGKKAVAHPEFAKWEKIAAAAESGSSEEDAMQHLEKSSEEKLYLEAKLYHLRRAIASDVEGFSDYGEHLLMPQEFAAKYHTDVNTATNIFEDALNDTSALLQDIERRQNRGRDTFNSRNEAVQFEIKVTEDRLSRAMAEAA